MDDSTFLGSYEGKVHGGKGFFYDCFNAASPRAGWATGGCLLPSVHWCVTHLEGRVSRSRAEERI